MSVFRNIRVFPSHGDRSSAITWELEPGRVTGEVFVAFSSTAAPGSWIVRNSDAPVAALAGTYADTDLNMNSGWEMGYYRLLLVDGGDFFSEPVLICGDLTRREYGIVRGIMSREFTLMRATNGYPVWHCVPRTTGQRALNTDPDTNETPGLECPDVPIEDASFGLPFLGGFYPPVLTWLRPGKIERGTIEDAPSDTASRETDTMDVRLLAWPTPARGHMFVDPTTDRRWLVGDRITPHTLRGVFPYAYETKLFFLSQGDPRYRFQVPAIDTRAYRRIT